MGIIKLKNIRSYSYHGCLQEEGIIGSEYSVDLEIKADFSKSCLSDYLDDTVDYFLLNKIVEEQMAIRSKLLEQVAKRIIDQVFDVVPMVTKVKVGVSKINPPIGGDVESVTVELEENRR
jgi:dihydroneopterin aldolase